VARIRTIKPEFFTSLTIDKLSLAAQRTFAGLLTYADDYGKGIDDARLIKAALWPLRDEHTPAKVEEDMAAIAALGLILRYTYGEGRYFQILGWNEHQRVNRPSPSKLPEPPPPEGSPRAHAQLTEGSLSSNGTLTESSPQERKGTRERNGREENHASLTESSNQNLKPKFDPDCAECGSQGWDCVRCSRARLEVAS
jgi:hypothetical protein